MSYIFRLREAQISAIRALNAKGGKEFYATVVKSGYNEKTVTCKVDFYAKVPKYKIVFRRTSKFHVHDPLDMCRVGDKVYIHSCSKVSSIKHYYVRNFFRMSPRINFVISNYLPFEKDAIAYNLKLQQNSLLSLPKL